MKTHYVWNDAYKAAVLEIDDRKLPSRIRAAKVAIDARLHDLQANQGGTPTERRAISDALATTRVLRAELATFLFVFGKRPRTRR